MNPGIIPQAVTDIFEYIRAVSRDLFCIGLMFSLETESPIRISPSSKLSRDLQRTAQRSPSA